MCKKDLDANYLEVNMLNYFIQNFKFLRSIFESIQILKFQVKFFKFKHCGII